MLIGWACLWLGPNNYVFSNLQSQDCAQTPEFMFLMHTLNRTLEDCEEQFHWILQNVYWIRIADPVRFHFLFSTVYFTQLDVAGYLYMIISLHLHLHLVI